MHKPVLWFYISIFLIKIMSLEFLRYSPFLILRLRVPKIRSLRIQHPGIFFINNLILSNTSYGIIVLKNDFTSG